MRLYMFKYRESTHFGLQVFIVMYKNTYITEFLSEFKAQEYCLKHNKLIAIK